MKVKGTKSSLGANGKLNFFPTENIDVNFDRVMAVTLVRGGNTMEFRYCPMDRDHQYEARIDAEIVLKPKAAKVGINPGFSATVRLYNVGEDVINMIVGRKDSNPSSFEFQKSLSDKCQITIRAGYWDRSVKTADEAFKKVPTLFGGFVNSSARYRKGNDIVTELYCHNIRLDIKDGTNTITDKLKQAINEDASEKKIMDILRGVFKEVGNSSSTNTNTKYLKQLIEDVIMEHAPSMSSAYQPVYGALLSKKGAEKNAQQSDYAVQVSDNLRYTKNWFAIHFINRSVSQKALEDWVKIEEYKAGFTDEPIYGFTLPKATIRTDESVQRVLTELLSKSKQKISYLGVTYNRQQAHFYFYVPEQDSSVKIQDVQDGSKTIGINEIVTIYNFQNFLDAPVIDGRGCFVAKMMFNPECDAGKFLKLEWQNERSPIGAISKLTEGVALNAQMGFSFPSLQGGLYQAQVAAMLSNNGYLFEGYYRMINVTHKLSTHGNEWMTTVKTAPGTARK